MASNQIKSTSTSAGEFFAGFTSYNDDSTEISPLNILGGVWTEVVCDGLGSGTNLSHKPEGVSNLWNVATNSLVFSELSNENYCLVRLQFKVTPSVNESVCSIRVQWTTESGYQFELDKRIGLLNEGSGIPYVLSDQVIVYVGDDDARLGSGKIQVKCDSDSTVEIDTVFIGVN